jgi:hypothetical protein
MSVCIDMMRWKVALLTAMLALFATGCERHAAESSLEVVNAKSPIATPRVTSSKEQYSLGIVGYNYTEVGIYDYSVNGKGAFNLGVSSERSGGGSTVCCFSWTPAVKLPVPIRIEWTRDGETWCRKTVSFEGPPAVEPTTLEVHFFPDRHIEVAVTDAYSPPRLKLFSAGADYRVGEDVRAEKAEAVRRDKEVADCRSGAFPIGEAQGTGPNK